MLRITDDGRGIDRDAVRAAAVRRGIIDHDTLSDEECFHLIFMPGFSSATDVSQLSGRGVGLDAVRESVLKVNGSIDVESEPNRGTTLTITILRAR